MSERVIAVVAGQTLTEEDFNQFVQDLPREQQAYLGDPAAKTYFEEEMISIYLFEQYAKDQKINESEVYKDQMKRIERSILSQMAMEKVVNAVDVTEEEKKEYFEQHKDEFANGATAQAKHILMTDEEALMKVLEEINSGAKTFEAAAQEYSTCPSGQRGGDLGEFGRGQMVKEFEEAVFGGKEGQVIGPVATQFGYHLIKVEKLNEGGEVSYEEAAEKVGSTLLRAKQQQAYAAKVDELKKAYCK